MIVWWWVVEKYKYVQGKINRKFRNVFRKYIKKCVAVRSCTFYVLVQFWPLYVLIWFKNDLLKTHKFLANKVNNRYIDKWRTNTLKTMTKYIENLAIGSESL